MTEIRDKKTPEEMDAVARRARERDGRAMGDELRAALERLTRWAEKAGTYWGPSLIETTPGSKGWGSSRTCHVCWGPKTDLPHPVRHTDDCPLAFAQAALARPPAPDAGKPAMIQIDWHDRAARDRCDCGGEIAFDLTDARYATRGLCGGCGRRAWLDWRLRLSRPGEDGPPAKREYSIDDARLGTGGEDLRYRAGSTVDTLRDLIRQMTASVDYLAGGPPRPGSGAAGLCVCDHERAMHIPRGCLTVGCLCLSYEPVSSRSESGA